MEFLESVLLGMKEQEIREFRYFLNRHPHSGTTDSAGLRRDLTLLELIRKNPGLLETEDYSIQLYGNKDRNAYHQLRSRLRKSLEEFIFFDNARKGLEFEIRKQIEIARYLFLKKAYIQGYMAIQKAETLAMDEDNYTELSIIYNLLITYASHLNQVSLPDLLNKRKINNDKLDKQFHKIYLTSQIRSLLESGEKLNSHIDIDYAINRIMSQHGIKDEDPEHAILWLEISALVTEILLKNNKLDVLEQYLILKHHEYGERTVYSSAGNGFRLRMLWQITGLLFLNHKFDTLEKYLNELRYETVKLNDYYPDLSEKLKIIEAVAGIHTGQLARSRQIVLSLNSDIELAPWKTWAELLLAEAENRLPEITACITQLESCPFRPTSDYFFLSTGVMRIRQGIFGNAIAEDKLKKLEQEFQSWLLQDASEPYKQWMKQLATSPGVPAPIVRLPEAGSLGFLTWV